jgi:hypothetical protein
MVDSLTYLRLAKEENYYAKKSLNYIRNNTKLRLKANFYFNYLSLTVL